MKILDILWFCGRSNVGIVRVEDEWDGIRYYIGSPPFVEYAPQNEDFDKNWIADWGSSFPREVGDLLFGVKETPYEIGKRLRKDGYGVSDIWGAVERDSDMEECQRGYDGKCKEG